MGCINDREKTDSIVQITVPQTDQYKKTNDDNSFMEQYSSCQRKQIKIETQTNTTFTEKTNKREELIWFPRLEVYVYQTETHKEIDTILITPNSVSKLKGCCIIKSSGIFSFGNNKEENDYTIEQISDQEFFIKYVNKQFYISENSTSTGVFVKIQTSKIIKEDKIIISFANCYIGLQTLEDNKLNISFYNENDQGSHTLNQNEDKQKCFKIGRGEECDIIIKNNSISRVQCSLIFFNNNWIIYDEIKDKPSLNGLW